MAAEAVRERAFMVMAMIKVGKWRSAVLWKKNLVARKGEKAVMPCRHVDVITTTVPIVGRRIIKRHKVQRVS